jgi:GntR family transcriptional regulator
MEIVLSSSSGVPMYEQIKTQIRNAVHSGDLSTGTMLPSLRQLAAQLRVSVITVTRAYNDLVAERVIVNEHGRGFAVLPIDPDAARAALVDRLQSTLTEVVAAARALRLSRSELHTRLDDEWNENLR